MSRIEDVCQKKLNGEHFCSKFTIKTSKEDMHRIIFQAILSDNKKAYSKIYAAVHPNQGSNPLDSKSALPSRQLSSENKNAANLMV